MMGEWEGEGNRWRVPLGLSLERERINRGRKRESSHAQGLCFEKIDETPNPLGPTYLRSRVNAHA